MVTYSHPWSVIHTIYASRYLPVCLFQVWQLVLVWEELLVLEWSSLPCKLASPNHTMEIKDLSNIIIIKYFLLCYYLKNAFTGMQDQFHACSPPPLTLSQFLTLLTPYPYSYWSPIPRPSPPIFFIFFALTWIWTPNLWLWSPSSSPLCRTSNRCKFAHICCSY